MKLKLCAFKMPPISTIRLATIVSAPFFQHFFQHSSVILCPFFRSILPQVTPVFSSIFDKKKRKEEMT